MMTTMLGCLAGVCANAGLAVPSAIVPLTINALNNGFSFIDYSNVMIGLQP
jgi:hypothetical protein